MQSFFVIALWAALLDGLSKWWAYRFAPIIVFNTEIGRNGFTEHETTAITLIVLMALIYVVNRGRTMVPEMVYPAGVVTGGAIGNLISRFTGPTGVLDFIPFGGYSLGNMADVWIIGGAVVTVYVVGRAAFRERFGRR